MSEAEYEGPSQQARCDRSARRGQPGAVASTHTLRDGLYA